MHDQYDSHHLGNPHKPLVLSRADTINQNHNMTKCNILIGEAAIFLIKAKCMKNKKNFIMKYY